jgi:8-oxo-dGTP diphosphatase
MKDWDRIIKTPHVTVDAVVMDKGKILLVKRKNIPFIGQWALPGGFVERGETLKAAVSREALEETGLKVVPQKIIGIYDDPKRDPLRGHVVTVGFLCKLMGGRLRPQFEEVKETRFFPVQEISRLKIAFDHRKIITDALKMRGRKS